MFSVGCIATVDKIEMFEKRTTCKVFTMKEGNKDFIGFVTLVGKAHDKAVDIDVSDGIKILEFALTTKSANGRWYTNVTVFDIEIEKNDGTVINDDESLPFS